MSDIECAKQKLLDLIDGFEQDEQEVSNLNYFIAEELDSSGEANVLFSSEYGKTFIVVGTDVLKVVIPTKSHDDGTHMVLCAISEVVDCKPDEYYTEISYYEEGRQVGNDDYEMMCTFKVYGK